MNLRSLISTALFIAIAVLLNFLRVYLTVSLRISTSFLAIAATGMLFGPFPAMAAGGITDLISVWLSGQQPYPGFTLTAVLGGLIYGLLLYKKDRLLVVRVIVAKGLVNVFCNMLLNTLWLQNLTGASFLALLPARAVKNVVLWLPEAFILYIVLQAVYRVWNATRAKQGAVPKPIGAGMKTCRCGAEISVHETYCTHCLGIEVLKSTALVAACLGLTIALTLFLGTRFALGTWYWILSLMPTLVAVWFAGYRFRPPRRQE